MANEDEVSLLDEPFPWSNLKQKNQRYSWGLGVTLILAFSSISFLLGAAIGPYWPGRLEALCLVKTAIRCE